MRPTPSARKRASARGSARGTRTASGQRKGQEIYALSTATGCYAAEMIWDADEAERFRQLCREAIRRDCVCQDGERCFLMDRALEMGGTTVVEDDPFIKTLAWMSTVSTDQLRQFDEQCATQRADKV
jgi:hypothetical protein